MMTPQEYDNHINNPEHLDSYIKDIDRAMKNMRHSITVQENMKHFIPKLYDYIEKHGWQAFHCNYDGFIELGWKKKSIKPWWKFW